MKRSVQEIIELVVFGAIALLIGTGLLWLAGWIFSGLGWLFQAVSGLVWRLLIVLVPIVLVIGLIYWLVNMYTSQRKATAATASGMAAETGSTSVPVAGSTGSADTWGSSAAAPVEPAAVSSSDDSPEAQATAAAVEAEFVALDEVTSAEAPAGLPADHEAVPAAVTEAPPAEDATVTPPPAEPEVSEAEPQADADALPGTDPDDRPLRNG